MPMRKSGKSADQDIFKCEFVWRLFVSLSCMLLLVGTEGPPRRDFLTLSFSFLTFNSFHCDDCRLIDIIPCLDSARFFDLA